MKTPQFNTQTPALAALEFPPASALALLAPWTRTSAHALLLSAINLKPRIRACTSASIYASSKRATGLRLLAKLSLTPIFYRTLFASSVGAFGLESLAAIVSLLRAYLARAYELDRCAERKAARLLGPRASAGESRAMENARAAIGFEQLRAAGAFA